MAYEYEYVRHMEGTHFHAFLVSIHQRIHHWHEDFELLMVTEGSVVVHLAGEDHLLTQGDLFLTNSNEVHSLSRTRENNALIALQFHPRFCRSYFPGLQRTRFLEHGLGEERHEEDARQIRRLLVDFLADYYRRDAGYAFKLMGMLNQIVYHLVRALPNEEAADENLLTEQRDLSRLSRILKTIDERYALGVSLKDLAAQEKLDMFYLSHFFKKQMGISFQDYLMRRRVERAVELLLQNRVTLTEICMEAGFSDGRYLNRAFRQIYGCSPQAYRGLHAGLGAAVPERAPCGPDAEQEHAARARDTASGRSAFGQDRCFEPGEAMAAIGRYAVR